MKYRLWLDCGEGRDSSHLIWIQNARYRLSHHFHNLFHELVKHWQILTKRLLVSCTSCKCFHIFVKNIYLWFNISLCHKGRNQVNIFSSLSPISYFSERTLPWLNHLLFLMKVYTRRVVVVRTGYSDASIKNVFQVSCTTQWSTCGHTVNIKTVTFNSYQNLHLCFRSKSIIPHKLYFLSFVALITSQ